MSRYQFTNSSGREVYYGLDKPTGGYFFDELYTDKEMESMTTDDNLCYGQDQMTLTELITDLYDRYDYVVNNTIRNNLIRNYHDSPNPTPLQFNVGEMFGMTLTEMLERVEEDLNQNYK